MNVQCSDIVVGKGQSECIEMPIKKKCFKTGKVMLTKHSAVELCRRAIEIHHHYKCVCGSYHVSSTPNKSKKKYR
jgi:hypothetical protein